jgi:hypothetical protein
MCFAQPSEVHIAFYCPMFPLFYVVDEDFKPNHNGKKPYHFNSCFYEVLYYNVYKTLSQIDLNLLYLLGIKNIAAVLINGYSRDQ